MQTNLALSMIIKGNSNSDSSELKTYNSHDSLVFVNSNIGTIFFH